MEKSPGEGFKLRGFVRKTLRKYFKPIPVYQAVIWRQRFANAYAFIAFSFFAFFTYACYKKGVQENLTPRELISRTSASGNVHVIKIRNFKIVDEYNFIEEKK